ncbi:MAG: MauE/DoxX family redox-associated membrane protein [Syntrophobacteraceae bacterium]
MMSYHDFALKALTSKYLALAFRLYIGGLFIYASIYKINYTAEFAESIAAYQLVPYWSVNALALVMSWTELICGVLLVAGIRTKSAAFIICAMLAVFTAAISLALIREIPMGCGCFSSTEDPMSWMTIVRDLVWMAMAAHVYFFDSALQLERKFLVSMTEV